VFFADAFASNGAPRDDALAVSLAPLRGRDASLASGLDGYAIPAGTPAGATRLAVLTAAEWLRDPKGYDADAAARRALETLAGADPGAREALRIQVLEWGGPPDTPADHPWSRANPERAAVWVDDPAAVASLTWVAARYPERLRALDAVRDAEFREAVRTVMARRLVVARAMPHVVAYRERARAGRRDAADYLALIEERRKDPDLDPDARRILDAFLRAADVPIRP
jgi:hypothetical protein